MGAFSTLPMLPRGRMAQAFAEWAESEAGMAAMREAAQDELEAYFADNPVEVDDDYLAQIVAAAVYDYLQANPPPAGPQGEAGAPGSAGTPGATGQTGATGRAPTFSEIFDVVTAYLAQYPPQKGDTGATGATGAAGRAPTAQEIAAAVAAYLTANPPQRGEKGETGSTGATGQTGATGAAGQNATDAQVAAAVQAYLTANPAATFSIGTVTSGANASVTITGTARAPVLNFVLPMAGRVDLPDVVLTEGGIVLALGPRKVTVPCVGAKVGDRIQLFAPTHKVNGGATIAGTPAGYVMGDATCDQADRIVVSFYGPALVVLTTYAITLKASAFR